MLLDQESINVTTDPVPCADDINFCVEKDPVVRCARMSAFVKGLVVDVNIFVEWSGLLAIDDGHTKEMEITSASSQLIVFLETTSCWLINK